MSQSQSADFSAAIAFAVAHETPWPRDIGAHLQAGAFEPAPWNEVLGPTAPRGAPNGLVLRGGHWGGGVFIHAEDQALIGQLMLHDGVWHGTRLLPEGWVAAMRTPCALKPDYGLLWWLNTDRAYKPAASPESYFGLGAGGNITWIDPANDLVAVLRWIDPAAVDGFIERVLSAR